MRVYPALAFSAVPILPIYVPCFEPPALVSATLLNHYQENRPCKPQIEHLSRFDADDRPASQIEDR